MDLQATNTRIDSDTNTGNIHHSILSENYEEIATFLTDPSSLVTSTLLSAAITLKSSGVLRLLLMSSSADPNLVLETAASSEKSNEMLTALLEDRRISHGEALSKTLVIACELGRVSDVTLVLKHPRFPKKEHMTYVSTAIENNRDAVLRILLKEFALDEVDTYSAIAQVCKKKFVHCLVVLLGQPSKSCLDSVIRSRVIDSTIGKTRVIERYRDQLFLCALETYSIEIFSRMIEYLGTGSLSQACFTALVSPTKGEMFRLYIRKLETYQLRALLNRCIEEDKHCRVRDIESFGYPLDAKDVSLCVAQDSVKCLGFILSKGVPYCALPEPGSHKDHLCCLRQAVLKFKDDVCMMMLNTGTCQHTSSILELSIKYMCYKTAAVMISNSSDLSHSIVSTILATGSDILIKALIDSQVRISHEQIRECIVNKRIRALEIVCPRILIDVSWNDYCLLKEAASDLVLASTIYKALFSGQHLSQFEEGNREIPPELIVSHASTDDVKIEESTEKSDDVIFVRSI